VRHSGRCLGLVDRDGAEDEFPFPGYPLGGWEGAGGRLLVSRSDIERAVAILRAGGLVVFPTETVYGLGADARNPDAIRRLFAAKGRPADHPVIVHLADVDMLRDWARDVPPAAEQLAAAFWPGPLTLILPRAPDVLDLVTGGQDSVGLRVPSHPVAHDLLAAFGDGIVAPSANRFGRISATHAEHVRAEMGDAVDLILDGGPTDVGVESTIVALTGERPVLLRPGGITPGQIASVLGAPPDQPNYAAPRASGTLPSHYAPRTVLEVVSADRLSQRAACLRDGGERIGVLARGTAPTLEDATAWHMLPENAKGYARALYASMRHVDALGYDRILVEAVPDGDAWLAIRDRLRRAAAPRSPE
jgi:L-threonylcarbamoyladenylate synthase